ncbi:MAG: hypothetical protein PHX83_13690 [Acidobacteriia bacterium]|nr:hypothetical protein [Terriglobia bacterium]
MFTFREFAVCLLAAFFVVTLLFSTYVMYVGLKKGGGLLRRRAQALARAVIQLKARRLAEKFSLLK